jgi:hypothetical protein
MTSQLALSEPSGSARGTVTTHAGGEGTAFFGGPFVPTLLDAGFRVVQVKWQDGGWEHGELGGRGSGCFPATVYTWVYANVQGCNAAESFCGIGFSGGSASLGYALSQYGLGQLYDYVLLESGPAVSDMTVGCDPGNYSGPIPSLCPSIPDPIASSSLLTSTINGQERTTSCGCDAGGAVDDAGLAACILPSDYAKWAVDSVVSPSGEYSYPQTAMSFWYCGNDNTNGSTLGAFYYAAVQNAGTDVAAYCYGGDAGPVSTCSGEDVFDSDSQAFSQAASVFLSADGCIPRH